jgi:hypothetical protein
MRIQDAIDQLTEMYDPNEEIIIAWWDFDSFDHIVNDYQTFKTLVENWESDFDWSGAHDDIVWWLTHRNDDE